MNQNEKRPLLHEKRPLLQCLSPSQLASWTISSALTSADPPPPQPTLAQFRAHQLHGSSQSVVNTILLCLCVVTVFEKPLWCNGDDDGCVAKDGGQIYLSTVPYIPRDISICVESLLYVAFLFVEFCSESSNIRVMRMVSCFISLADAAIYTSIGGSPFRIAPFLRLLLAATSPTILPTLKETRSIMVPFVNVMLLYVR